MYARHPPAEPVVSVRGIVEQNRGKMEITHTDTQFIVTVMLEQYRTKIMR